MTDERVLVDTNVLIHHINGDKRIERYLQDKTIHISFITEVEILSFPGYTADERAAVKLWLREFIVSGAEERIRSIAIDLRAQYRLKLADAFVAATAAYWNIPLVTEDNHFKKLKHEIALRMLEV
jgi:predicted nucleic acid-binding protein